MLKLAAQEGHIDLKYLDESGCALESPVSYSYVRIGQQKHIEQVKSYGDRISILGLWQVGQSIRAEKNAKRQAKRLGNRAMR